MPEKRLTELTRGEEEIMRILWQLGDAVVNEIIARTEEPHPKYTTVATFLKILENKGFVGHRSEGKSYRYFPLVRKEEYAHCVMSSMLDSYFDGSLVQLVSFFSRHEEIPESEIRELQEIIKQTER
ncbi:MAG TPA: BlaI/MecI/CopY family transcriptional regulator [Candidatus Tidjanibacter gallistercoris]|nr:BlaI/MecI/CopY family transcriptional regulator [Candidatus Tidjanibacter gallistercoris]